MGLLLYYYLELNLKRVRVGLFCETYDALKDRQLSKMKMEFPLWLGELKRTEADGLCFFLREEYGSGMIALRNLDDPSKYKSAEFAAIASDELTMNLMDKFNTLRGSLRWKGVDHTVFLAATNPGEKGHIWVKRLWIDKVFPPEMKDIKDQFTFIKALPKDNPYLSEQYWIDLNSQPEEIRKAWVDGDWDVFEGRAFPTFNPTRHVIEPQALPAYWPKWRATDWGYANPFCCLWLCKNPDNGRVYVYREVYYAGLTDRKQAKLIMEVTPEDNVSLTFADPSMWTRKNVQDVVTSTADEYAAVGLPLIRGDNDRMSGKRKIDRLLELLPDGQPGLLIMKNCPHLIEQLGGLARDKHRVEDVDTDQEDHAYDTLRYGLTSQRAQMKQAVRKREVSGLERISII